MVVYIINVLFIQLRSMIVKSFFASLIIATGLTYSALGNSTSIGSLNITGCWVRPSTGGPNTAAYMTIKNEGAEQDKLIKADCAFATTVELHNHIHENGVMKMRPVQSIDVVNKESVEMKPGGLHVMLMGLKPDFKNQETIKITLHFEKSGRVDIDFPVKVPATL